MWEKWICSLKFSNASFVFEPIVCPKKKEINNDGGKVYNILIEKVASKSNSKKGKKTYNFCDNFSFHGTEAKYSNEGDNYETNRIKEDKYGCKHNKKTKDIIKKKRRFE